MITQSHADVVFSDEKSFDKRWDLTLSPTAGRFIVLLGFSDIYHRLMSVALFCVLVVSTSVDVGAALVQNRVDVLCSK